MLSEKCLDLEKIDDISKVIALTERVKKRKNEYLAAIPHFDSERSRFATESWKESEGEPLDIRRAKLLKKIMEKIPVVIKEGELIVGSQTKYIRGAGPAVDWDPKYSFDLTGADRPTLSSLVKIGKISDTEKKSLLEDANYWKGKSPVDAIAKVRREIFGDQIEDLIEARVLTVPDKRPHGARVPNIEKVIKQGLNGIIADARDRIQKLSFSEKDAIKKYYFLQAVIISCEGAINFAHRHAELAKGLAGKEGDAVRKKELEKIADICLRVPAKPARTFHEALQSLWLTHLSVNLESSYSSETLGRIDQYLYPFYRKDLENNALTRQQASELLGCLWIKLSEMERVSGKVQGSVGQAGQFQCVTIGGVTKDGRDATNAITYLVLEVTRQLKTVQPSLYLRCHQRTPNELWLKAVEVNGERGDGQPAFVSDEAVLLNFVAKNVPIQEARCWVVGSCAHPDMTSSVHTAPAHINVAKIFELTLNNGVDPRSGKQLGLATGSPTDFKSFNNLYDAFKQQFDYFVNLFGKSWRLFQQINNEYYRLPFLSALMDDCIDKGMDFMLGGARYPHLCFLSQDRGHQDVADSLSAINKFVFEEKKLSMDELLEALKVNFEGKQELQQMLLSAPKYGNDDDYVDDIFNDLSLWTQRRMGQEKNIFGTNMRVMRSGATVHAHLGKTVGALPSGRKAWEPLADGSLSPMRGLDVKGPTAVINSASKVNHTEVATTSLFNMKFSRNVLKGREGLQRIVALIKTYFERGGYHLQFNLMGNEVLHEAKKHPEKYRDLLVRVAGYSALFVELSSEMQDDIIARTEHTL